MTNDKIISTHWQALRQCTSQRQFDQQIEHLIFDWDSNHCGLDGRACIAIGLVNRSSHAVQARQKPIAPP